MATPKSDNAKIASDYKTWLKDLKLRYKNAQIKASVAVNHELLGFYFELGKDISEKQFQNVYGSKFYSNLSHDLRQEIPDAKGFSPTNLKYAFYFYELYKNVPKEIRQQLVDDLKRVPWGHHIVLIDKCKNKPEKALFYVRRTIENNWSRNVLLNFLDTNLFEREGKAITNFSQKLAFPQRELAQQITKDPYCFDFLSVRQNYDERELKNALISNVEKFLLELGRGFAYMGREFRLEIGKTEQFWICFFTTRNCIVMLSSK